MTIESDLASIKINLGRIADSLEALAANQGIVPDLPGDEPKSEEPAKKKAASKKKATTKKAPAKKKKKAAEKAPAEKEEKAESKLTIKDDVRPILKRLRDEVNHAAVKSLLKKFGASTIQGIDEKDYARLIEAAKAELGDEDDDEQDDLFDDIDDDEDEDDDL